MAQRKGKSISITLFEKNNRIGGNILTERVGDFLIEGGPDCFLSEKPWAIQLCEWLGMGESLLRTNDEYRRTYIYWKGRLRELPEGIMLMIPTRFIPLLKSNLFSLAGKFRMGMELFIPKRKSGGMRASLNLSAADLDRRLLRGWQSLLLQASMPKILTP